VAGALKATGSISAKASAHPSASLKPGPEKFIEVTAIQFLQEFCQLPVILLCELADASLGGAAFC
jgi:hypothetical protein